MAGAWQHAPGTMMDLLVTSAGAANGGGHDALLRFANIDGPVPLIGFVPDVFCNDPRLADPRGLGFDAASDRVFVNSGTDRILALDLAGNVVADSGEIPGLNPGGGNFGPDGTYHAGMRSLRSILAIDPSLNGAEHARPLLAPGIVPFPRGFAFGADGRLFLASGMGPDGRGEDCILAFGPDGKPLADWRGGDAGLSPLDLMISPRGTLLVSSEKPFGQPGAQTSIREYAPDDGKLIRVFYPSSMVEFVRPRGLRMSPDGNVYCVCRDEVVVFDYESGKCAGALLRCPRLNGQALIFLP